MSIVVFDTETTGLAKYGYPPEHPSQPRLVQLAFMELCDDGTATEFEVIVAPRGEYEIPQVCVDVHGISTAKAEAEGHDLLPAVTPFFEALQRAKLLVAHNFQFDQRIMEAAFFHAGLSYELLRSVEHYCTCANAKDVVKCPPTARMIAAGRNHYKNPKLEEAFKHFTGQDMEGAHDALADVRGCVTVYKSLVDLGVAGGMEMT